MSVVHLNVGGAKYSASTTTLCRDPNSMLSAMLKQREEQNLIAAGKTIFIDRNGRLFEFILDYLRDGSSLCLPDKVGILERLLKEADFFQMTEFTDAIKAKLTRIAKYQPTLKIGESVKFVAAAVNNLIMQEYFDMMNDARYTDIKFGPDIQDRLEKVPCWFCGDSAAQKLKNSALVADNWQPRERLAKSEAFLLATWGEVKSVNVTCCLTKFVYPNYLGAVVLREDANFKRYFQREPVNNVLLHVPIQFLERVLPPGDENLP